MASLKRICTVILLTFLTTYYTESTMQDSRSSFNHPSLKKLIEPLSYGIRLQLPFKEDDHMFFGRKTYLFVIENPTRKIDLNANGLTIISLLSLSRYPYNDKYKLKNYHYSNETETLTFDFETDVPSGLYYSSLTFWGNISEKEIGLYRTSCKDCNGASKWIYTTQLQPTAARRVFPCWDEPSLKARVAIEIVHHRNYTVLSNMPMKSHENHPAGNDMMWTEFHPTPPIPIYLIAFSLTNFTCYDKPGTGITTRLCCRPLVKDQMIIARNTSEAVALYLQWYVGIFSQQPSQITNIGLPDFPYDAIGNWRLNIYRESHLKYNETLHPIDHKFNVSVNVASMVALQWFGNLVSPTSWTHMWFFQTLALFYGAKAAAETYPNEEIKFMFTYWLQSLAREDNAVSKMDLVMSEADTHDDSEIFIKSNHFTKCLREYAIMVMLEYAVTEPVFRNATSEYIKKHQFSSATPDDFWGMIKDKIDNGVQESFNDYPSIIEIMHVWSKQRSLPMITVNRGEFDDVIIRQEYMDIEEDCENIDNLLIHMNYVTMSNPESITGFTWLGWHERIRVPKIPLSDLVIVNWQQAGYYRVRYDSWIWRKLTTYLRSENYAKIHVLSRAHIIEDAHYFWSQNDLRYEKFIDLIKYMNREKQCAPWYAMQKVFQKMWTFLNMDASKEIKDAILDSLNQLLQEVGYTEHPDDAECVKFKRLLAIKWACRLFHEECLDIAKERLIEHLKDIKSHIIPPMWEEWTYCNGLVRSDMSTWVEVFKEFEETKNMRIIEYLGCSGNSSIIVDHLNHLMSDYSLQPDEFGLSVQDRQRIYRSIVEKHIRSSKVLDYVLRRMKKLLKNFTKMEFDDESFVEELSFITEKVYSFNQMNQIISLLEDNVDTDSKYYHNWIRPIIERQILQIHNLEQLAY